MRKTIHSPEQQVLCGLLRDARLRAKLRQDDVAQALDRPQSYVSKYESGERRLDVIELRSVCQVLGTSLPAFVRRLESALSSSHSAPERKEVTM